MSPRLMKLMMNPRVQALMAQPQKLMALLVGVPLAILIVLGVALQLIVGIWWLSIVIPLIIGALTVAVATWKIRKAQASMMAQMQQMEEMMGSFGNMFGGPGAPSPFGAPGASPFGGPGFGANPFAPTADGDIPASTNAEQLAQLLAAFDEPAPDSQAPANDQLAGLNTATSPLTDTATGAGGVIDASHDTTSANDSSSSSSDNSSSYESSSSDSSSSYDSGSSSSDSSSSSGE